MTRAMLALVFTLMSTIALWAEVLVVNSPGDGFLNLRTGPGSQYNIIMPMQHGTTVETLEIKGSWARVRHESGNVGWAFRQHMVSFDDGVQMRRVYSPGDGFLNLRSGPGSDFAVLRRMYHGDWVQILERKGNWVRVHHPSGTEGWAYSKYLRK